MSYSESFNEILKCIPISDGQDINWEAIEKTKLGLLFDIMKKTPQNPVHHAEGDVYCHTKCVCEELIKLSEYRNSSYEDKIILFLSALLHDTGKIICTKTEDGRIVAPGHAAKGTLMARELLWKEFGLCGSEEKQQLRESICALIKYHSFPPHVIKDSKAEQKMLRIASVSKLAKGFNLKKVCILSDADVLGRECYDKQEYLERNDYCKILAEDLGCLDKAYIFKDNFSQRAYFLNRTTWRDQEMFNDTWGKVIMVCGLPGTGKDTWISKNHPDLPMVSLDNIRKQLNILPTDNQGKVISTAQGRVKELLRNKQPFVWNATNITESLRMKWISLFEQYGAGVEIVFLETEWEAELQRNSDRQDVVPVSKIADMLSKLEIPQPFESENVRWDIT